MRPDMIETKIYGAAGLSALAAGTSWVITAMPYAQFAAAVVAAVAGLVSIYIAVQNYRRKR